MYLYTKWNVFNIKYIVEMYLNTKYIFKMYLTLYGPNSFFVVFSGHNLR